MDVEAWKPVQSGACSSQYSARPGCRVVHSHTASLCIAVVRGDGAHRLGSATAARPSVPRARRLPRDVTRGRCRHEGGCARRLWRRGARARARHAAPPPAARTPSACTWPRVWAPACSRGRAARRARPRSCHPRRRPRQGTRRAVRGGQRRCRPDRHRPIRHRHRPRRARPAAARLACCGRHRHVPAGRGWRRPSRGAATAARRSEAKRDPAVAHETRTWRAASLRPALRHVASSAPPRRTSASCA